MDAVVSNVVPEVPSRKPLAHEQPLQIGERKDDRINLTRLDCSVENRPVNHRRPPVQSILPLGVNTRAKPRSDTPRNAMPGYTAGLRRPTT